VADPPGNILFYGDNLDVLRQHVPDESIDLVYLDPPFNSNAEYNVLFGHADGSRPAHKSRRSATPFGDTWRFRAPYHRALPPFQRGAAIGRRPWSRALIGLPPVQGRSRGYYGVPESRGGRVTRVRLNDGVELWIEASLEDARNAWRKALADAQMLEITGRDGAVVAVNPNQVLYLEEPSVNGQRSRLPEPA
jgi:hypothetical protein